MIAKVLGKDLCRLAFLLGMVGVVLHIVDGSAITTIFNSIGYAIHGGAPPVASAVAHERAP